MHIKHIWLNSFSFIFALVVFVLRKMWGKSIRKFIDELDVNSRVYFVLLLILGITISATVYVNHKLKLEKEVSLSLEQVESMQNTVTIFSK